jgi:transcriptional regulator with XRE-family HTH domain
MNRRIYPNIAAYLHATGQTQAELAEALGLAQGHMSRIIRRLQQPSLDLALRIARHTRVPVDSLVRADPSSESLSS